MKILYFTNIPSPYRINFFNELSKTNDVTVLFNYDKKENYRNDKWYEEKKYNFKSISIKSFSLFKLNQILSKGKYDVIVLGTYANLNGALLNILLRLKKIPFFINADGGFIPNKESFISKLLKNKFLGTANYYLSTGKETDKYLLNYGAKKEKIYHYNFTSLVSSDILEQPISSIEKRELRKKYNFNYDKLFISVGSFIYRKGYDIFLEAIKDLDNYKIGFIIVGGGEKKSEYEKFLDNYHIDNVHFIDFCSKKEIFNYYKMSDVFFFPSREDIWGLVINEAMACGLPIISSDNVIAAKELLGEKSTYKVNSTYQLRSKIDEYILKSSEDLYNEGLNNIKIIKNYTIENMVRQHINIFGEVIINDKRKK